ncbi:hypothetical protein BC936DRAFT_138857 [Jimgerdemannia flammicorona]|uniref:Uncharacterized protein n=1 Tax=Jimgerdemannia flammicorona TaxID=994334 RepID=A0A433BFW5_9FUNG|nr:hypothetical protein BC936DRAFT_138857 [Jimgerdemannia flammicorona]
MLRLRVAAQGFTLLAARRRVLEQEK